MRTRLDAALQDTDTDTDTETKTETATATPMAPCCARSEGGWETGRLSKGQECEGSRVRGVKSAEKYRLMTARQSPTLATYTRTSPAPVHPVIAHLARHLALALALPLALPMPLPLHAPRYRSLTLCCFPPRSLLLLFALARSLLSLTPSTPLPSPGALASAEWTRPDTPAFPSLVVFLEKKTRDACLPRKTKLQAPGFPPEGGSLPAMSATIAVDPSRAFW